MKCGNDRRLAPVLALLVYSAFLIFTVVQAHAQTVGTPVITPRSSPTIKPIVRPDITVLPDQAIGERKSLSSYHIERKSPDSITFSGKLPALKKGAVLVSGHGQGTLRKVVSSKTVDDCTTVQTAPAALTDVFEQADIRFNKLLDASDLGEVQTAPGVTLRRPSTSGGIVKRATTTTDPLTFDIANVDDIDRV